MDQKLDKLTAVRLDQRTAKTLEKIGEELDRPVSWLMRKAIDEYIERWKAGKKG